MGADAAGVAGVLLDFETGTEVKVDSGTGTWVVARYGEPGVGLDVGSLG